MPRVLPVLIVLVLTVYSLIDCARSETSQVRKLPRTIWALLIVLLPVIGSLAWLIAGRPRNPGLAQGRTSQTRPPAPNRPTAPDDDPDFLGNLRRRLEYDEKLRKWEEENQTGTQGPEADPEVGPAGAS